MRTISISRSHRSRSRGDRGDSALRDGIAIGIDAGGTKTLGILVDSSARELARADGPGANPTSGGREAARSALASVIGPLLSGGSVRALCLGSAGIGRDGGEQAAEEDLRSLVPGSVDVKVCTDAVAALGVTGSSRPAMVVIAGTGSNVYGERVDGSSMRLGGHGAVIGDPGSGAALGLAALRHTARVLDREAPRGALADAISVRLGVRAAREIVERIGWPSLDVALVASLAPLVLEASRIGDTIADSIIAAEGDALAADAEFVARGIRTDAPLVVLLAGSILGKFRAIRDRVDSSLRETGPIRLEEGISPVNGAARLALSLLGL